jgi:ABC-type transporter Mla MlaB component
MMRAGPDSSPPTLALVIAGQVARDNGAALCERVRALLGDSDARLVVCDVAGLSDADIATIDALARLQLTARRLGGTIRLRHAPVELRELLVMAGLAEVVPCSERLPVEPRGETEQREELRGVEEGADPADPPA